MNSDDHPDFDRRPTRAVAAAAAAAAAPALDSPEDQLPPLPPQQQALPSSSANHITPSLTKKQKKARQANYMTGEDIALCKTFVNYTLNPINGTEQKEKVFAIVVHQNFVALITEAGDPEELKLLPVRDVESILNRWNRRKQQKINEFLSFWRQAKLYSPSRTSTEEEILSHAEELFYKAKDRQFIYGHCMFILKQVPKFDTMISPTAATEVTVVDLATGEKGGDCSSLRSPPAVNYIGAPMGASLARPIGSKKAKKLLKKDPGSSQSNITSMSTSMEALAAIYESMTKTMALKEKKDALRSLFKMYRSMGDMEEVNKILQQVRQLNNISMEETPTPVPSPTNEEVVVGASSSCTGENDFNATGMIDNIERELGMKQKKY